MSLLTSKQKFVEPFNCETGKILLSPTIERLTQNQFKIFDFLKGSLCR